MLVVLLLISLQLVMLYILLIVKYQEDRRTIWAIIRM
nr:MAG TPA: hypothetical protein [Caudoviricetes sp.]